MVPFKTTPFKKLASDAALETHSRLEQLEKDVQFLRRAVQKNQSELELYNSRTNTLEDLLIQHQIRWENSNLGIFKLIEQIRKSILKHPPAITAAKPKQRKRTKQTAKRRPSAKRP